MNTPKPLTIALIGAGNRGAFAYAPYALQHPDKAKFVAVADPDPEKRTYFAKTHGIAPEMVFETDEALLAQPQLADAILISTQDWQHVEAGVKAMQVGYDVLLEKPMANTLEDCLRLVRTSEETGNQLQICHVLRFTNHFTKLREILRSGVIGKVIDVDHRENVSFWHMAHSFVRGNWGNEEKSSPMILAKCCHDLDILTWMMDDQCESLSSIGDLQHFTIDNKPVGAPLRCTDGCLVGDSCIYNADRFYHDKTTIVRGLAESAQGFERFILKTYLKAPWLIHILAVVYPRLKILTDYREWPINILLPQVKQMDRKDIPDAITHALETNPYGRCVYQCDNDVVDHQVVTMQFAKGASVVLTMQGHSHREYRSTRIDGTLGTIFAEFGQAGSWVEVHDKLTGKITRYNTSATAESGHGGGDLGLMESFVRSLSGEIAPQSSASDAIESHLMAFASEKARKEKSVIDFPAYKANLRS